MFPLSVTDKICLQLRLILTSQFLQEHVDEFVESVTEFACRMAKHRKSKVVEARDVQLHLETNWNIRIPGYGDDPRPTRRTGTQPIHNARLQAVARNQPHGSQLNN